MDLMKLWVVLEDLLKIDKLNTQLAYAIYKNKKLLQDEVETIREIGKASPALVDFQTKRIELCKEFADKDEHKKPIIVGTDYKIISRKQEFEEELKLLTEDYKDVVSEQEAKNKEINEILKEDINGFAFRKIKLEWLPETISGAAIGVLDYIIED
jgi:hypothetical protein